MLACLSSSRADTEPGQTTSTAVPLLRFAFHATSVASKDLAGLRRLVSPGRIRVFEPYEGREVSFDAVSLTAVLDAVYSQDWRAQEELLFTCSDGYQPSVPVQRVLRHRAWLAFDRADGESFSILKLESGSRQRIVLAPFYLIWENLDDPQVLLEGDYGWPYQLVGIDVIRARDRFPNTAPAEDASQRVLAGYASFRVHCSRCHAINGEGGSIGPELNVPVSPVDYRGRAWLQRWIDDPAAIRPESRMPRMNPALPDRADTIDDIIAYLEAMSQRKRPLRVKTVDDS